MEQTLAALSDEQTLLSALPAGAIGSSALSEDSS
jgi:hypothetical protein